MNYEIQSECILFKNPNILSCRLHQYLIQLKRRQFFSELCIIQSNAIVPRLFDIKLDKKVEIELVAKKS
jgi:hypothetical protein